MPILRYLLVRKEKNQLTYRLLMYVVLCSTVFTFLATLFQLYLDYRRDLAIISVNTNFIKTSYLNSISFSLFSYDEQQVQLQLEGITKLNHIDYVEIIEDGAVKLSAGDKDVNWKKVHQLPIEFTGLSKRKFSLGTLIIISNLKTIFMDLWGRFLVILLTNAVKLFLAATCIFMIIRFLLIRHLEHMADFVNHVTAARDQIKLSLNRKTHPHIKPDELDQLVRAINNMHETISHDLVLQKEAEINLKLANDKLEQRVEARTKDLELTNRQLSDEIKARQGFEDKLIAANKKTEAANMAKSEFLANMSHELRTPMHAILSYSKFGIEKTDKVNREKLRDYFEKTHHSADQLMMLLNDLLDLSKAESGRMDFDFGIHDLRGIAQACIEEFDSILKEKSITIVIDSNESSMRILCDPYRIGQVVRNLMSNAIKFSNSGDRIDVVISPFQFKDDSTVPPRFSPALVVKVKDHGIGLPEEELDSVFDKFIQSSKTKTGAGGTGLGLAISKEIIKAHSGTIWAENNSDGGATFSFTLPL